MSADLNIASVLDWPVPHSCAAVVCDNHVFTSGDVHRIYELASVTKLLVAAAALIAVDEGAISLEDPLGPSGSTVRHLLSHASGLGPDGDEVVCLPATQRIYSSRGFEIVAEHITQSTQIPFDQYLFEAICQPLGMHHTHLKGGAGFGAVSTAGDLVLFSQEILAPQFLPSLLLREAVQVQFPGISGFVPGYGKYNPNPWGLGFEIHGTKAPHWLGLNQPENVVGHFGAVGTFLWCDRDRNLSVVVLTDRNFGPWAKPLWSNFNGQLYDQLTL